MGNNLKSLRDLRDPLQHKYGKGNYRVRAAGDIQIKEVDPSTGKKVWKKLGNVWSAFDRAKIKAMGKPSPTDIPVVDKDEYPICCTGDVVVGDKIWFPLAIFNGQYPYGEFSHYEQIEAIVAKDSYGIMKQQHTFTLAVLDQTAYMKIKGRRLYRNGVWRKPWANEGLRRTAQEEKHARGAKARKERQRRLANQEIEQ